MARQTWGEQSQGARKLYTTESRLNLAVEKAL